MAVFIGVDVGTGSVRAGVFDANGHLLASARRPITLWQDPGERVEQSSRDIFAGVVASVREAVAEAGIDPAEVGGIGFDATCSLVVVGKEGQSLAVGPHGDPDRDIIVWMDHRAREAARRINATRHVVLDYVGGQVSPEMQTPKLLWLAETMPETFAAAAHFFDLSDWLVHRVTGSLDRSICTLTCKWTYLAHEGRFDAGFFEAIGLGILAEEGFRRIGTRVVAPGTPVGTGLTAEAAAALGLLPGTPVGAPLIDAHAGGLGSLGARDADGKATDPARQLGYIFGTSACAMATSPVPRFVPGVWGPYYAAMLPGLWLIEGGQSAAGAAMDHLVDLHPATPAARAEAARRAMPLFALIEARIAALAPDAEARARFLAPLQVVPEFLGNRAPNADPDARATIMGLGLDEDFDSLARLYLAGLAGIGYGARQIVDALAEAGVGIETIVISGGAGQSDLVRRVLAEATGLAIAVPETAEPVLLGAAILGAVAGGAFPSTLQAIPAMSRLAARFEPPQGMSARLHAAKYAIFLELQRAERRARQIMEEAAAPA